MYVKFKWIRVVRGLTPIERNVLTYLSERADNETGITAGIYSRTIAMKCETTQNNVFKVLRSLQSTKGFLKSRTVRPGKYANRYALNLGMCRPKNDDAGVAIWADVCRQLLQDETAARYHVKNSDAWFNRKTKTLTVWFDAGSDLNYFKDEVKKVIKICHAHKPRISLIELLPKVPVSETET